MVFINMLKIIKDTFFAELSNWILWLVVFFASGIGFYFSLDKEPSLYLVSSISWLLAVAVLLVRNRKPLWLLLLPAFFFLFGITIATWRTHSLWAEKLSTRVNTAKVYGVVEKIIPSEGKAVRLVLNVKRVYADEKVSVKKLQVMSMNFNDEVRIGDFISLYASLSPPSKKLFPSGYDFARHAYFNQVGGHAFSISKIKIIEPARDDSIASRIENLRLKIYHLLTAGLGPTNGSVAAALMIGEQRAINKDIMQAMRDSGLVHIISVSGLHMSLLAVICFFIVRHLLSYSLQISQQYNTKKIAAWISFALSLGYLLISGLQVAAVRSFFMLATLMAGILIDRQNNPKRSVFLAAFLILLFTPEAIFHPSFQMSFSAVLALVGTYEIYSQKIWAVQGRSASIVNKVVSYFLGVLLSSFVAGTATSIYVMYHFHNYSNYSMLANLLVAPIVSFLIMPSVILIFILMPLPFGIYKLGLYPLDIGITLMLKIANYVSLLPKAQAITPTTSVAIPLLFTAGLLWFCIWEKKWRILGAVPMITAFCLIFLAPFPDIIIDEKYKAVLLKDNGSSNALTQLSGPKRISKFHKAQWLNLLDTNQQEINCSTRTIMKGLYRISSELQTLPGMCIPNKAAKELDKLTVTNLKTGHGVTIHRKDLEDQGDHFIYLNKDNVRIQRSINRNISRPWS